MKRLDAVSLKPGDLVVLDNRNKSYAGLVLEVESNDTVSDFWCCRVTLKQPGFDIGFRLKDYDSRYLQRFEP